MKNKEPFRKSLNKTERLKEIIAEYGWVILTLIVIFLTVYTYIIEHVI